MSEVIKVYDRDSKEYARLKAAAEYLNALVPYTVNKPDIRFTVEDTYFDYGQNWRWTTIICHAKQDLSYQILSPRDLKDLLLCDATGFTGALLNLYKAEIMGIPRD